MEDVVPGALLRLREADIVSMAGLTGAALGQEYCRTGAVHSTKRQGRRLSGIVDVPHIAQTAVESVWADTSGGRVTDASTTIEAQKAKGANTEPGSYDIEVEVQDTSLWNATCACNSQQKSSSLCAHAAALLYQWLARPFTFESSFRAHSSSDLTAILKVSPVKEPAFKNGEVVEDGVRRTALQAGKGQLNAWREEALSQFPRSSSSFEAKQRPAGELAYRPGSRETVEAPSIGDILALAKVSDLRSIAGEYDIATTGLSKQQILEALVGAFQQSEAIRRVVGTLEKPLRQLLAAFTLAGGSMSDDDLRGLFERFSLGRSDQLQSMLSILQGKALVFRTGLNSSLQPHTSWSISARDAVWHVPREVRAALHVTLPITPFNVQGDNSIEYAEPYGLLADLLLIARALDGYRLDPNEERKRQGESGRVRQSGGLANSISSPSIEKSIAIPPAIGRPSSTLIEWLRSVVARPPAFLRFAVRLLRLADILYIETEAETSHLHALPNAARLLLGPLSGEVAHELWTLWLMQATYEEVFDVQEGGVRLCCHATALNQPALRPGELEMENGEARGFLLALLAQAPRNTWISFSAFVRFVYRLNPLFLQKRQYQLTTPHWWFEQEDLAEGERSIRPLRPTQLHDWLLAEGRYLAQLVQGPLHWWGGSDIALSRDGRLLAFRLTPLSEQLLRGMATGGHSENMRDFARLIDSHEAEGRSNVPLLRISKDGDLLMPCTFARWPQIELVERFAEVAGVHANQLCYRLTQKSLSEALSSGEDPVNLLELLRQAAEDEAEPPAPLTHLLAQVERSVANYGRVRLYSGTSLLEVADSAVLRELSAITSLEKQIVQPLSSTRFILKKQGGERLIEELKRRGQVPLVHEEEFDGSE